MKRKFVAAGAAVVLVTGGGAWLGLGSATATTAKPSIHGWPTSVGSASAAKTIAAVKAAAAQDGSQVLILRAHQFAHANIDVNGDGFGPGDYFMFEENLRYQGSSDIVGQDSVKCTVAPTTFICDGTIDLFGQGKIAVYSALFGPKDSSIAVTGGTDSFKRVSGQLQTANLRHGDSLLAFQLTR
ncbi:MAG: hypothetical protein QOI06_3116 [Nocardioidaceae bacterium]|jgi:hypothetical protein|nr:hypothetical protein [Nocardioidaceae bacterium]